MNDKEYFGSYFTGIFEASGCISIYNNNRYPKITISFHKNNKVLAEAIRERIGFGSIYEKKNGYSYEIFNRYGVLRFIEITQKYLRTPKIDNFNNLVQHMNTYRGCTLPLATLNSQGFDSNGWLSGYLEINGSFNVTIFTDGYFRFNSGDCNYRKYLRSRCGFQLTHKKTDKSNNSFEPFMLSLANFLKTELKDKLMYNRNLFILHFVNEDSIIVLLNYFDKFPLFGYQYARFIIFEKSFFLQSDISMLRNRIHASDIDEERIKDIIKEILYIKEEFDNSPLQEIEDKYIKEHLLSMPRFD